MTISSVEWGPLGWGFGVDCRRGTVDHLLPNVRTLFPPKSVEVGFSGCFLGGSSYLLRIGRCCNSHPILRRILSGILMRQNLEMSPQGMIRIIGPVKRGSRDPGVSCLKRSPSR